MLAMARATRISAPWLFRQEKTDLFKEPLRRRVLLQQDMIVALQGDKSGAGNPGRELASRIKRYLRVAARME